MHRTARLLVALPTLALAVAAVRAFADGGTGTLRLKGIVPQACTVSVQDQGVVLDLGSGGQSRTVAAIEERCNAPAGYTVTLSSRNGGELRAEAGDGLPYAMSYDGAAPAGQGTVVATRPPGISTKDLAVSTPAAPNLRAGAYEDVITVTVQAK
jgi:type 1 fimbria pilin